MNSFYGVLATSACRFASGPLAGAITEFGHYILRWTRKLLESRGAKVLYGDTDSVFVDAGLEEGIDEEEALKRAREMCAWVNEELSAHVEETYGVTSRLELEFEKFYRRFFLPPMRGDEERGRAKGYAGLKVQDRSEEVEIIGMEAVRRDWTDMAHDFQRDLLDLLFHGATSEDLTHRVIEWVDAVRSGKKDDDLVYRKGLRKKVEAYTKSSPQHVKAARLLPKPRGVIRYVITSEGPQPLGYVTSPIDYEHYVEKQIAPIAQTVAQVRPIDVRRIISLEPDLFSQVNPEERDQRSVTREQ